MRQNLKTSIAEKGVKKSAEKVASNSKPQQFPPVSRARLELASDYSSHKVLRYFGRHSISHFRYKTGFFGCGIFSLACCVFIYTRGKEVQNEYVRYAMAGTLALVSVELSTHVIDTYNQRSKVIKVENKGLNKMAL